jgi:hypothetical protein
MKVIYLLIQFAENYILRVIPVQLRQINQQVPQQVVHCVILRVSKFLLDRLTGLVDRYQHLLRFRHLHHDNLSQINQDLMELVVKELTFG